MKQLIFKLHLFLGLTSGLVVFIVATTGSIYCFEEEFRNNIYKDLLYVQPSSEKQKPVSELIQAAKKEYPKPGIKNIRIKADPASSVEIILKNKQSILVDPYTGKVLGTFNKETDFLGVILQIHRRLYLGKTGEMITGISALIFFVMLVSGIILWWPNNKRTRRQKFSIAKNAARPKRIYDLHSVLGFYAAWVLIFSVTTGLVWSFKWFESSMYWLSGSKKEEKMNLKSEYSKDAKSLGIDRIIESSSFLYTTSEERFINMPEDSVGPVKITFRYPSDGFLKIQDQLQFDQYSGKLLKASLFETASSGDKLKATNYDIHTGRIFGLTGKFIVFFAALIAASLPVTGFMMWRKKRKSQVPGPRSEFSSN